MKFRFTPDMFSFFEYSRNRTNAASLANAALDKHLESLVKGRGFKFVNEWRFGESKQQSDTHTAYLFDLEELEKKACEHKVVVASFKSGELNQGVGECEVCGAKLRAKWEEVK